MFEFIVSGKHISFITLTTYVISIEHFLKFKYQKIDISYI